MKYILYIKTLLLLWGCDWRYCVFTSCMSINSISTTYFVKNSLLIIPFPCPRVDPNVLLHQLPGSIPKNKKVRHANSDRIQYFASIDLNSV